MIADVKDSAAISQAIITGGAVAGASFALFQSHPKKPDKSLIELDLALLLIPSLLLGTSIGKLYHICVQLGLLLYRYRAPVVCRTFLALVAWYMHYM